MSKYLLLLITVAVAIIVLFSRSTNAPATGNPASFAPAWAVALNRPSTSANSSVTISVTVPGPGTNHLLGLAQFGVPNGWGLANGSTIADGDVVGSVNLWVDIGCDGLADPPLTAVLTNLVDGDSVGHWVATLGPPLNMDLDILADVNLDDPDVAYDISVSLFYGNPPVTLCDPMTFVLAINERSGLGQPIFTNPSVASSTPPYYWQGLFYSSPVPLLEHIVSSFHPVCVGPTCPAKTDTDTDGFSDTLEAHVVTDPFQTCSSPADVTGNGLVDIGDISAVSSFFGKSVPLAPVRYDIAADPLFNNVIDIGDISRVSGFFGQVFCTPPATPTPTPSPSPTPVPTPCPDTDGDGWTDCAEGIIGTDPLASCATSPTHDAWPADLDNDTFSGISDISLVSAAFGTAVPPALARYDIAPDSPNQFVDIGDISRMAGLFGRACTP